MRVVHLISGLMYGGGQKVALDLLDGLKASNEIDTELWLLGCRVKALRERADFVASYDGRYSSPATLVRTALIVRKKLATSAINVVHSHGWDADMIGYLATLGREEARVVHLHVTPAWIRSRALQHRVRRMMTRGVLGADRLRVLAVAKAVKDHWSRTFENLAATASVVYNSADPDRFFPRPPAVAGKELLTFGVACRLTRQKGLHVLVQALQEVSRQTSARVALKIAGEGPELELLRRQADELGVAGIVEFSGHVSNIERFYQMLDVMVLPAVSDEGMPLAIIEAMASGLPVITTNVGGSAEAVRDGIDGLVVCPNDPTALARAMIAIAESPAWLRSMGTSGRNRAVTTFSPQAQLSAVKSVYADLVSQRPPDRYNQNSRAESPAPTDLELSA